MQQISRLGKFSSRLALAHWPVMIPLMHSILSTEAITIYQLQVQCIVSLFKSVLAKVHEEINTCKICFKR